jgi:hypothetical protein
LNKVTTAIPITQEQYLAQPEIEKEIVMKVSFGKNINIKMTNGYTTHFSYPFPNFMILHIPRFLHKQQTHQSMIKILLLIRPGKILLIS